MPADKDPVFPVKKSETQSLRDTTERFSANSFTLDSVVNSRGPWFTEVIPGKSLLFQLYLQKKGDEWPVSLVGSVPGASKNPRHVFIELRAESKGGRQIRYARVYEQLDNRPTQRVEFDGFIQNVRSLAAIDLSSSSNKSAQLILRRVPSLDDV